MKLNQVSVSVLAELGPAQSQLVLNFNDNLNLDVLINFDSLRFEVGLGGGWG